jgi:VWFA-related protein
MSKRLTSITGIAIVAALVAAGSTRTAGRGLEAGKRTVYVSVVDKNGASVTDIQAGDLEVKEGGKTMEIVSVKPASAPLRIALLDSDAGYGAYQAGILKFINKLMGKAEFSIVSVIVQPMRLNDYSSDPAELKKGLEGVGRRGVQRGSQLMEAINEAAKTVNAEGKRPVIVAMRVGGEAVSPLNPKEVRDQLKKSGAALYVISVRGVDQQSADAGAAGGNGSSMTAAGQQAQLRDSETTEGNANLQQILNDGSKESGGHFIEVGQTTLTPAVEKLADELLTQYEVIYAVPDGTKPSDKLVVGTKRKNVTVYAPSRPPM